MRSDSNTTVDDIDRLAGGFLAWIIRADQTLWYVCMIDFITDQFARLKIIGGTRGETPDEALLLVSSAGSKHRNCSVRARIGDVLIVSLG